MSQASEQLRAELDATRAMPFGIARSAAVESLVEQADELGDEALLVQAQLRLMTAYSYGGEPLKRFPVFSWLLGRYDRARELFDDDDQYRLLWMFKSVTVGAVEHPAVPLDRIMAGLDEMAQHYAAAREAPAPVLSCRFQVLARVQGHEAADEVYRAWTAAPRTPLSDCQTCEPALRVWHLAAIGQDSQALGHAFPVLDHGGCADQPQRMIGHAVEPMLRLGMAQRAAREHLRGVRLLRERPGSTATWAQHVLLCARTGRLHRGLDLLESRLHEVDDAAVPEDAMWLAAAGARLLRGLEDAGEQDLPIREYAIGDGGLQEHAVGDLRARLARRALELADRFDRRNATSVVGAQVTSWLDAPPLPDLPIDRVLTRPRSRRAGPPPLSGAWQARPSGAASATPPDAAGRQRRGPFRPAAAGSFTAVGDHTGPIDVRLVGADPATLADGLADAEGAGSTATRTAVLAHWAAVRQVAQHVAREGDPDGQQPQSLAVARLDAALALDRAARGELTPDKARAAATQLNEAGEPGAALRHALACIRMELGRGADPEHIVADAMALVLEGERIAPPGDQACLQLGLAALLHQMAPGAGAAADTLHERARAATARGLLAVEHVPASELTPAQRAAVALLRRDHALTLPLPGRIAALTAALELLPPGMQPRERALVGYALGTGLAESAQTGPAAQALATAADDALAAADDTLAVHTQHALGRALADAGDAGGAVEALSRAVELCGPDAGALLLAELRQGLAAALRDTGEAVEAAELADAALDELEDALDAWGIQPDPGDGPPAVDDAGRVAGDLAFTAAQCAQALGENDLAADLARRAAAWADGAGDPQAEAMMLAAQCTRHVPEAADLYARAAELFTATGRWWDAAGCRRARALSILDSRGLEEALIALEEADGELARTRPGHQEEVRLVWEGLALAEQRARILAGAGEVDEALVAVEGLDDAFRTIGDGATAREVIGLKARMLDELGRTTEALPILSSAAEEALADGDRQQAGRLGGYLSAFLDDLGMSDQANAIWQRFAPSDGPVPAPGSPGSGFVPAGVAGRAEAVRPAPSG